MNQYQKPEDMDTNNPYRSPEYTSDGRSSKSKSVKTSRSGLRIVVITFAPFVYYLLLFLYSFIFLPDGGDVDAKQAGAASLGLSAALCIFSLPSLLYAIIAEATFKRVDHFITRMIFPIVQCFLAGYIIEEIYGYIGIAYGFLVGLVILSIHDIYYDEYLPLTPRTTDLNEDDDGPADLSFLEN